MNTTHLLSRRDFIRKGATVAVLANSLPATIGVLAAGDKRWPVGCRDIHLKLAGKADSWSCMKALGAECTEVQVDSDLACRVLFHPDRHYTVATAEGIRALKEDLAASGCRISAFMMSNQFEERLEQELEAARKLVQAAHQLGAGAIRIDLAPRAMSKEEFLPFAIGACKRLCQTAEGTQVRFGVENHGRVTNDPAFLEKLFEGVGSSRLGLTLDCANFYWWGHPLQQLYGIYERFARKVVHTHCKSIAFPADKKDVKREMGWGYEKYNCPVHIGDIDFQRLTDLLRKADYRGDLCVEDESLGKYPESGRAEIVKQEIAFLKKFA